MLCENCGAHPGTVRWSGDADSMTIARLGESVVQRWCRCCVLRAQIAHAEKLAATLPGLRAELAMACPPPERT